MHLAIVGIEESAKRVQEALDEAKRVHKSAHEAALFIVAGEALSAALPPVQTGELRDSKYLERQMPIEGGFSAAHAAKVHETHPTQRKFWQLAFSASTSTLNRRIEELLPSLIAGRVSLETVPAVHPEKPQAHTPRRQLNRGRLAGRRRS